MFLEKKKCQTGWRFNFMGLFLSCCFTGCEKILFSADSSFYLTTLTLVSEEGQVIIESVNTTPDSAFNGKNIGVSSIGSFYDPRFGGQWHL